MTEKPFILTISGGSGSGKTTLARAICERLSGVTTAILSEDNYYFDRRSFPAFDEYTHDFDDAAAKDLEHLAHDLTALKAGKTIDMPVYDFATHSRTDETIQFAPTQIVVLEGIHGLVSPEIRALSDLVVYLDTPDDVRLARRILRDMKERDRTFDFVLRQYFTTVRKGHLRHVAPQKDHAHIVLSDSAPPPDLMRMPEGLRIDEMADAVVAELNKRRSDTV
jgi:uridine kinase